MSPQNTIDCFADVSTQEACTVTQKRDLDQMSERSIRTLTEGHKDDQTHFLLQIIFGVYWLGMALFGRF